MNELNRRGKNVVLTALTVLILLGFYSSYNRRSEESDRSRKNREQETSKLATKKTQEHNDDSRADLSQNAGSLNDSKPATSEDPLPIVTIAKEEIMELTKAFEAENSKVLYHTKLPKSEVSAVAVTAPDTEQISRISDRMTQLIEKTDATQRAKVRRELEKLYEETVSYPANYRVFLFVLPDSASTASVIVSDTDDTSNLAPNKDGTISIQAKSTYSFNYKQGDAGLKKRYGHLLDFSE